MNHGIVFSGMDDMVFEGNRFIETDDQDEYWCRKIQRQWGTFAAAQCMSIDGFSLDAALRVLAGRR